MVLTGAAVVVVLLALAAGGLYWFLSGDDVRRALERGAAAWVGYPVHIGAASVALLPHASLTLRDVRVGEPS